MTADDGSRCSCKVGTAAAAYRLAGVHDSLRREWYEEGDASVRDLTGWFNRRLLRAAIEEAGRVPIDGEVDNLYRVLTDDAVDAGSRTRARDRLRDTGVAVEDVEERFVSHQTLYRHLVDCLDLEHESAHEGDDDRVDTWRDRIRSLRTRTARVTERGVDQLADADAVTVGNVDVLVDVSMVCEDCGEFYDVEEFLEERRCGCSADETE